MIKRRIIQHADDNSLLLNSTTNNVNNENVSYDNDKLEDLTHQFNMPEFENMDSATLRELHAAVTNFAQEPF